MHVIVTLCKNPTPWKSVTSANFVVTLFLSKLILSILAKPETVPLLLILGMTGYQLVKLEPSGSYVLDRRLSYFSWLKQPKPVLRLEEQVFEGTQRSVEVKSRATLNSCSGVPIFTYAKNWRYWGCSASSKA